MITAALARAIARYTDVQPGLNPYVTAVPGLTLVRSDCPMPSMPHVYKPTLCLVAQGAKRGTFGTTTVAYGAGQALVVGVEMPGAGSVTAASVTEPFLGAIIEFDLVVMREVLEGLNEPLASDRRDITGGVFVSDVGGHVAACVQRLVELLDTPRAIPALAPAIMRELSYWLLTGPDGGSIAAVIFGVDRSQRVMAAIHQLREHFTETIRVNDLAQTAQMSTSAFHRSFKTMTSMTPLQYQKQMRLHKARNLMLAEEASAETAAYSVGYESPSQFSREYARMFGAPPRREIVSAKTL